MKQQSPMLRLWELGEGQQGGLKRAVLSAVVGVLFGMLPYFAVAQIILGLLSGNQESSFYLTWCAVALVGFLLRATLYSLALSQSHKATFAILKSIREKVLEKLPKMPLTETSPLKWSKETPSPLSSLVCKTELSNSLK